MNFLKGLALTILTFLLFFSLALFGTLFTLNSTLLDPDFVAAQVDRLDVAALFKEMTAAQISGQIPPEAAFFEEALYGTIADNEPWLKEQGKAAVYSGYDYLLGKTESLNIMISLEPLKADLRDRTWQLFQQNLDKLPPQVAAAPPSMLEQYFAQFYEQYSEQIPSEFKFDESSIPPEVMANLQLVRENISYAQTAYYALIGFMVLLVLVIILLHRSVKGATRELGITFLLYGALDYASVWAMDKFLPGLPLPDVPPSLQTWLTGLIVDFAAPMQTLGIGLMACGAALIIISIIYPRLRPAAEE